MRVAIGATVLAIGGLYAYGVLTSHRFENVPLFWVTIAVALAGMGVMASMPWARLFRGKWGLRLMYAWSAMDIILISMLVVAVGGEHSEVFSIYVLTTIFFAAAAYPMHAQALLLGLTYAGYVSALAYTDGPWEPGVLVIKVVILAASAWMSSFLARSLLTQMGNHSSARGEADARAKLLAVVAGAAREISSLEPEEVLDRIIDAAAAMGLEAATVCLLADTDQTYQIKRARGLPKSYTEATHSTSTGMVARIIKAGKTVTIGDYSTLEDGIPAVKAEGFHATMGTPLWTSDGLAGVMIAGTRSRKVFVAEEIEAFELLASYAGRALENARRFEREHEALNALVELDRLKGDFISNMSHELRTPLTVISGMAATLDEKWQSMDDRMRAQFLMRIRANADDLHDSVLTLLDFAKISREGTQARIETIPVRSLFEETVHKLKSRLAHHVVEVIDASGLMVKADKRSIERVMDILVGNSTQHTPTATMIVIGAAVSAPGMVRISVSDNGPGIPAEEMRHLGEWFFRGGDPLTRQTRGIGLGLALCSKLLESQGSRLEIVSEPGEGAHFSFDLPQVTSLDIATNRTATVL